MDEPRIGAATAADVPAITDIVTTPIGTTSPVSASHPGRCWTITRRACWRARWGVEEGAAIAGIIVLLPARNYLLLDNVTVSPARQGLGLGRRLLAFAEAEALRRGYCEIRLYTHQTMLEKQRLYASIGYEETGRGTEAGYARVFMRKQLRR